MVRTADGSARDFRAIPARAVSARPLLRRRRVPFPALTPGLSSICRALGSAGLMRGEPGQVRCGPGGRSRELPERPMTHADLPETDTDDARLESLGYQPQLHRVLGLFANFAVAFTYLSPMVGIYSLFVLGLGTGGPAYVWLNWIPVIGMFF